MKIVIFSPEIPFPPIHGGRIDVWNRIVTLANEGNEIFLVTWVNDSTQINDDLINKINKYCSESVFYVKKRKILNYFQFSVPPFCLSYSLDSLQMNDLFEKIFAFNPQIVLMESWGTYLIVKEISKKLKKKIVYRSHNIEYLYFRKQFGFANGKSKFTVFFNSILLKKFEIKIRSEVDFILDITEEDKKHWKNYFSEKKHKNILCPFVFIPQSIVQTNLKDHNFDIAFIGNLWAPNNVNGLVWFTENVLPIIESNFNKKLSLAFIGSNPNEKILKIAAVHKIHLIKNPENLLGFYKDIKILINPIRYTGGINIKMVEMLYYGNKIVSTSAVLRGIPLELINFIKVADTFDSFANQCLQLLKSNISLDSFQKKEMIEKYFGKNNLLNIFNEIEKNL